MVAVPSQVGSLGHAVVCKGTSHMTGTGRREEGAQQAWERRGPQARTCTGGRGRTGGTIGTAMRGTREQERRQPEARLAQEVGATGMSIRDMYCTLRTAPAPLTHTLRTVQCYVNPNANPTPNPNFNPWDTTTPRTNVYIRIPISYSLDCPVPLEARDRREGNRRHESHHRHGNMHGKTGIGGTISRVAKGTAGTRHALAAAFLAARSTAALSLATCNAQGYAG